MTGVPTKSCCFATGKFRGPTLYGLVTCVKTFYRLERARSELRRVGLDDNKVWEFVQQRSLYDELLRKHLMLNKLTTNYGHFSCTMNHCRMMLTAYELGCGSLVGFEDDIVFLKDVGRIKEVMDALPEDADIALLEWRSCARWAEENKRSMDSDDGSNPFWHRANDMRLVGCGAYYCSRRGLQWWLSQLEAPAIYPNLYKFKAVDQYLHPEHFAAAGKEELNVYVAKTRVAVQASDDMCNSGSAQRVWDEYRLAGLANPEDYNLEA